MNPQDQILNKIDSQKLWDHELELKRNEYLKVAGSIDTNIYHVKEGSLRVFVMDENEEHTIRFGYQNNIIAALDSYISNEPSEMYIQALKKTRLKVISKDKFEALILSSPELTKTWYSILEHLIFGQLERERDLLTSSPIERYKRVLKRSPQLFQEIPNKYIASYLRMTPETLSRIKKS